MWLRSMPIQGLTVTCDFADVPASITIAAYKQNIGCLIMGRMQQGDVFEV